VIVALRDRYGAGPLHLIAVLASLAFAGYAIVEIAERPSPFSFAIWFGLAIVAHDLLAFPLYSLFGTLAGRALLPRGEAGRAALNHIRVPALLSAFAFVVWLPLILGLVDDRFPGATGLSTEPYLGRWLLLTGVLFAASGLLLAIRLRRLARGGG
jgi:hypothetical protein